MWDLCIRPCSIIADNLKITISRELHFSVLWKQKQSKPKMSFLYDSGFTSACSKSPPSPASALNDPNLSFCMTTDTWTDGCHRRQTGPARALKYIENHWQREWWSTWRGRETFCYATVNWLDKKNVSPLNVSHLRAGVNGTAGPAGAAQERGKLIRWTHLPH